MEPESAQRDSRVGVVLNGRYRITELLGEGGMGLVYRGERTQLGRPVAIKFLHSPYAKSPKYMARFEREARAMSKLSHPYCVSVIDFGVHDEPYIVMDFVTGQTLRDLLDQERVQPQRAIQITRQILAGLSHAHGQGVIHRDIKPGNVMVGEAVGVGDHVRIFDFGLAKLHDPAAEGDQSLATVIGTPAYMAPEQTRAEAIDARADLYAVGVLLFELLTGEKPFTGEDAYAVIRMQREAAPPRLRERAPELSGELELLVAKALEKARDDRFQTAAEFATALDQVPEAVARPTSVPDSGPPRREPPASAPTRHDASTTDSMSVEQRARSTRRALLGLALVAVVGAFAYVSSRERDDVSSAPVRGAPAAHRERALGANVAQPVPPAPPLAQPVLSQAGDAAGAAEPRSESDAGSFEVSDAGEEELHESELASADQALDEEAEIEAKPQVVHEPKVRTISDVHRLIDRKQVDAAILGLQELRRKNPKNPYLPYLIGDLYYGRGWISDALAKYREAMKLSDGYRRRVSIHKHAIAALSSDRTYAKARVLLVRDIGAVALKSLRAAAQRDPSPVIKKRAKLIADQLARR